MANINPGLDGSGNGNNWAPVNINFYTSSSTTYDVMTDVPTNTSATTANFCTLNPLNSYGSAATISNGNLNIVTPSANGGTTLGTIGVSSGKWYWEVTLVTQATFIQIGIVSVTATLAAYLESMSTALYFISGNKGTGPSGVNVAYGSSVANGDIVGVALDMDSGTLTYYKNGVSMGTAFTGISGTYTPGIGDSANTISTTSSVNFGQQPFTYTPPSGFVALNTYNLPTPTIGATASSQARNYENVVTYTGTGTSGLAITGVGFKPDLVWIKQRNEVVWHNLQDSVRGSGRSLFSNDTSAEYNDTGTRQVQFDSDGFTLIGSSPSNSDINKNGGSYVAWCWRANQGTNVTNTNGSITSTVSANTTSGFSVVTYTGTGSAATVGHGLGVAPKMVIVKKRSAADSWQVYHASLTSAAYRLVLNDTAAQSSTPTIWNSTAPTSTVFSIGTDSGVNTNTGTYVAYCFSEVAGFSKFGSYTGNSSTDGTFVYTGFRPRYIMIKASTTAQSWQVYDTARSPSNLNSLVLFPNLSNAEQNSSSAASLDALSNGFKLRVNDAGSNGAYTYIYMAFAESPFNYANAR